MLKIRLLRIGKKHEPHYRVVIMPARTKRDGKVIEFIGHYNPKTKDIKIDAGRAKYWISVGAQPTKTVHSILAKGKLLKPLNYPKRPPKKPKKEIQKEAKEAKVEKPKNVKKEIKKQEETEQNKQKKGEKKIKESTNKQEKEKKTKKK